MAKKRRVRKKTPAELADQALKRRSQRQHMIRTAAHAATDRLPKKRADFIRNVAGDYWVSDFHDADEEAFERESRKWNRLRTQFLRDCEEPLEFHLFAAIWNCDRGIAPLQRILKSDYCDAGTALWLYWENDPYFYQAYQYVKDAEGWEREWLQVSRAIERRFRRNDFATSKVPFDPEPWVTDKYADADWVVHQIPDVMYVPTGKPRRKRRT